MFDLSLRFLRVFLTFFPLFLFSSFWLSLDEIDEIDPDDEDDEDDDNEDDDDDEDDDGEDDLAAFFEARGLRPRSQGTTPRVGGSVQSNGSGDSEHQSQQSNQAQTTGDSQRLNVKIVLN